jgi:hypothetical protein
MEKQIELPSGGPLKVSPRVGELMMAQLRLVCAVEDTPEEAAALRARNAAKKAMTKDDWRSIAYVCGVVVGWAP